ncbi:MAG TPA: hypothetical protein DDW74_01790 [Porphyromonadaceae bacterium]|nr:hypothetical protein [Porphyromonadaceae bacterium]
MSRHGVFHLLFFYRVGYEFVDRQQAISFERNQCPVSRIFRFVPGRDVHRVANNFIGKELKAGQSGKIASGKFHKNGSSEVFICFLFIKPDLYILLFIDGICARCHSLIGIQDGLFLVCGYYGTIQLPDSIAHINLREHMGTV